MGATFAHRRVRSNASTGSITKMIVADEEENREELLSSIPTVESKRSKRSRAVKPSKPIVEKKEKKRRSDKAEKRRAESNSRVGSVP